MKYTVYESVLVLIVGLLVCYPIALLFEIRHGFRKIFSRTDKTVDRVLEVLLGETSEGEQENLHQPTFVGPGSEFKKKRHRRGHRGGKNRHRHDRQTRW